MSRVAIVRGPHKGTIVEHSPEHGPFFRVHSERTLAGRVLALAIGRPLRGPSVLYRVFSEAAPFDRDRADVYAGAWCEEHEAFLDRCPHAPEDPRMRRWVRFGPRFDQTQLEAGAPGTRESKWHLLKSWRQLEEPWITVCELIVYGPVIEELRHRVLTPVDAPICKGCKSIAGLVEHEAARLLREARRGERGAMR